MELKNLRSPTEMQSGCNNDGMDRVSFKGNLEMNKLQAVGVLSSYGVFFCSGGQGCLSHKT